MPHELEVISLNLFPSCVDMSKKKKKNHKKEKKVEKLSEFKK
jgi:hypothetical protein